MKKFLQIAMAASIVAAGTTACHDKEDGDGDYVADFTTVSGASQLPGMSYVANVSGINQYALQDAGGYIDIYHFSSSNLAPNDSIAYPLSGNTLAYIGNNFYGGFTPTWFTPTVDNEDDYYRYIYRPACGTYHSGSGALVCNPGALGCKAIFSRHIGADFATGMALLTVGKKVKSLCVAPSIGMSLLDSERYNKAKEEGWPVEEFTTLPANCKVEFVVYGYVKSFSFSNFKDALKTIVATGKDMASGGQFAGSVVLAESDAEGKVTINEEWQEIDLSNTEAYLWEVTLRVVNGNGTKVDNVLSDESSTNYCLVDDITFAGGFL